MSGSRAEPAASHLGDLTPVDVAAYLAADDRIIVPFGSIENNGPHLPLGIDTLAAVAIAEHVSAQTGVLVAPPIPWGLSSVNMGFPGTMTLSADTCHRVIAELCRSLAHHGFRRFALVTGHYNNVWAAGTAAEELRDQGLLVAQLDVWRCVEATCRDLVSTRELPFGHGGEMMTSVGLAVAPHAVRPDRFEPEWPDQSYGLKYYQSYPRVMGYAAWNEVSVSGMVGDPRAASTEVGREIVRRLGGLLAELLDDMRSATLPREVGRR
jgi:creatinine amidohydrolase/Fe(II)-dependent formamide hydrolase-like protein